MVSRRGLPKDIVCDNDTNFVGGSNELKELEALLGPQEDSGRYDQPWSQVEF